MSDFILSNLSKIIAVIALFEFEFVLIYRRRYLKNNTKPNTVMMVISILVFMDAFIYTVFSFSNPNVGSPVAGLIRFTAHCIAVVFFAVFYLVKDKAER